MSAPSHTLPIVVFELATLLIPPVEKKKYLLHFLDQQGIEIACRSSLSRNATKATLREVGLLSYFTELYFDDDGWWVENSLRIDTPEQATFRWIEEHIEQRLHAPAYARVFA